MKDFDKKDRAAGGLEERVIHVNRCAKVVKGGRRFSFSALIVVGDRAGRVGYALGKANEVADAIRKGTEIAKRNMFPVTMKDKTIPHEIESKFGGACIFMRPASPGTGVIAGGGMRAVLECAGVRNVLVEPGNGAEPSGNARFEVIVLSGSVPFVPESMLQRLSVGGRLAAIVGEGPAMEAQVITRTTEKSFSAANLFETSAKPLTGFPSKSHFTF